MLLPFHGTFFFIRGVAFVAFLTVRTGVAGGLASPLGASAASVTVPSPSRLGVSGFAGVWGLSSCDGARETSLEPSGVGSSAADMLATLSIAWNSAAACLRVSLLDLVRGYLPEDFRVLARGVLRSWPPCSQAASSESLDELPLPVPSLSQWRRSTSSSSPAV